MSISITITAQNDAELRGYAALIGLMAVPTSVIELTAPQGLVLDKDAFLGKPPRDPVADEAATQEEIASAAGALEEPEKPKRTRRTKEQIEADKAAAHGELPAAVGPDEAAKAVHQHTETTAAPAEGEVKKITIDFLRDEMQRISTEHGVNATRALLKKFGIPRVGVLEESRYAEFASAAAGWTAESA